MLSFIVPAYNEEALLGGTLTAIMTAAREVGEPFEVIVADDASTDRTGEIARAASARVLTVNHRQIAATRNAGARESMGAYLFFVDADTTINAAVVQEALAAMKQNAVGGGAPFQFDGRVPLYARILIPFALRFYRWNGLASGCFLFCRREAFVATGGFDESLFGAEEAAMSRALAKQGRFVFLRDHVVTSGRKLRAYSPWEIFGFLVRLAWHGPNSVKRRDGLELWYGERRPDC